MSATDSLCTDVLIVGAGPVGMITALLLARAGLESIVIEQRSGLHAAPQAHVITSRTMEICRQLGIDEGRMRALATNPADLGSVRWVKTLAGPDIGALSLIPDWAGIRAMQEQSPAAFCNLSQHLFEPILNDALPRPVLFDHTWQGVERDGDELRSTIRCADREVGITSRYLIGADGARSAVREAMGISMTGPDRLATFCNIHFSANLREHLGGRASILYWVMDPAYAGVFIAHDIDHTWVYMKAHEPDRPIPDEAGCRALLREVVGTDAFTIEHIGAWTMTAQIAEHYGSGRIYLAGDAAHRFPPTGGVGMNTGIQDAHNLVWKLAQVERGIAPALLDSYELERRPVAQANSDQSLANHRKMAEVAQAIGLSADLEASRRAIDRAISDPDHQATVQRAIAAQAEHFNMRGLDLGYCYRSDAIIADGEPPRPANPVSTYIPSTTPGARMPHAWLRATKDASGTQRSTLDLIDYARFTLLHAPDDSAAAATVDRLAARGTPIAAIGVGAGADLAPADENFATLFDLVDRPLLVRPDGHIAWRARRASDVAELGDVMAHLLPGVPSETDA